MLYALIHATICVRQWSIIPVMDKTVSQPAQHHHHIYYVHAVCSICFKSRWVLFWHFGWYRIVPLRVFTVFIIFLPSFPSPPFCRTIVNCNLRSIQARAFSQNPHLRYMWVNIFDDPIFSFLNSRDSVFTTLGFVTFTNHSLVWYCAW